MIPSFSSKGTVAPDHRKRRKKMNKNFTNFPHISNEMIDQGMRRARVERSKAVLALIDGLFGRDKKPRSLSEA